MPRVRWMLGDAPALTCAWFRMCQVNLHQGRKAPKRPVVSSLQAFWPALDVLAGDVHKAAQTYLPLWQLWRRYEALPEAYDIISGNPIHFAKDAPLRPELIESAYYLFTATGDHTFLRHGQHFLRALNTHSKVRCGYASIADVNTKRCVGVGVLYHGTLVSSEAHPPVGVYCSASTTVWTATSWLRPPSTCSCCSTMP